MKEYYCIDLKFKDARISLKTFHAHLFVSDEEMYFQIIDNDVGSQIDRNYSMSESALGLFEENFEITKTEVSLFFDKSRVYKMTSFQTDLQNTFFTIYVSKLALIFSNRHKEFVNEGKAFLNRNGLKVVNSFYSFFSNIMDKNQFSISRMDGMKDFYNVKKMSFRPELEFTNNEKRGSEEFTVKKIPTISYRFNDLNFDQAKKSLTTICNFLSFCFGIRVFFEKITFLTEEEIFVYRDTSPSNKTFVSDFSPVFYHLERNRNIQIILKTDWYSNYLKKEEQFNKAIDNYLHSREVGLTASFLLLFNIIEIFNVKEKIEKFTFNESKKENFEKSFELLLMSLKNKKDSDLLRAKWDGLINKIEIKPLRSPLEQTLRIHDINPLDFGFSFAKLKKTRDKLTHGSVSSIKEEVLKLQIFCLRKISSRLILANLGLKDDLKKVHN